MLKTYDYKDKNSAENGYIMYIHKILREQFITVNKDIVLRVVMDMMRKYPNKIIRYNKSLSWYFVQKIDGIISIYEKYDRVINIHSKTVQFSNEQLLDMKFFDKC